MEKGANSCQYPDFFKVYIPGSSSKSMKLPQDFLQRIPQEVIPKKVFLRNRYGGRWTVDFGNMGKDCFFEGPGWVQFVRENSLLEGHFLLFNFDGCDTFEFKIFERSGWERIVEDDKEKEVEVKVQEVEVKVEEVEVKVEALEEEEEKLNEEEDEDYAPAQQDGMQDEDEEEEEERICKRQRKGKGNGRGRGKGKSKEATFDIYGADIFKSGANIRPMNHYFVTKLRKSRLGELFIPNDIVKDLNYELPETLIVRDERGKTYRLEADAWNDGRIWYKRGWHRLCKSNCIGEEDRIICEFIKSDEKPSVEMQVRVVRSGNASK